MSNRIGVLISTYDRVMDARINMELIRTVWSQDPLLKDAVIVHAFNGKQAWYPAKTTEDDLVVLKKNTGHFRGATELLDAGMLQFAKHHKDVRCVVALSSDTWIVKPETVAAIITAMQKKNKPYATCAWGLPDRHTLFDVGAAVDLFAVDVPWAVKYGMFPIRFTEFVEKYGELMLYKSGSNVSVEKLILARFLQAMVNEDGIKANLKARAMQKMHRIVKRESVHTHVDDQGYWHRTMFWPDMGLLTHHDPVEKQKATRELGVTAGPLMKEFLDATSFDGYVSS